MNVQPQSETSRFQNLAILGITIARQANKDRFSGETSDPLRQQLIQLREIRKALDRTGVINAPIDESPNAQKDLSLLPNLAAELSRTALFPDRREALFKVMDKIEILTRRLCGNSPSDRLESGSRAETALVRKYTTGGFKSLNGIGEIQYLVYAIKDPRILAILLLEVRANSRSLLSSDRVGTLSLIEAITDVSKQKGQNAEVAKEAGYAVISLSSQKNLAQNLLGIVAM